jgi:hypothetical protein
MVDVEFLLELALGAVVVVFVLLAIGTALMEREK